MLPVVIHENLVHFFKFHHQGTVSTGMRLNQQLYKPVQFFYSQQRAEAYALGCKLGQQRYQAVVTVSPQGYHVWVEVGASIASLNLSTDASVLRETSHSSKGDRPTSTGVVAPFHRATPKPKQRLLSPMAIAPANSYSIPPHFQKYLRMGSVSYAMG
jgi:hypothetical protein